MPKESAIEVVGGEIIGEKAEMLREHESLIAEVGLEIPPTTVIASETVQAHSGLNGQTEAELKSVTEKYRTSPAIVIRSSAEGDGAGNGVYESGFATNSLEFIVEEASLVIDSFSTDSAKDFRRQAKLGDSFALMVQPIIGQDLDTTEHWEHFGPCLSGFGYSSSTQHLNGYMNVVAGIGGGVDRLGGQILTPEEIEDVASKSILFSERYKNGAPLNFYEFLDALTQLDMSDPRSNERNDFRSGDGIFAHELTKREFALARYLIREAGTQKYTLKTNGLLSAGMEEPTGQTNEKGRPEYEFVESEFLQATKKFMPDKLFETMNKLEKLAGYPVYIEWAMDSETRPVILQVAPAEQTSRNKKEANLQGDIIAEAKSLLGNGTRKSSKIIAIASPDDIEHLREFNGDPDNEGYILIFGSALSSNRSMRPLNYADCSKAGALIEMQATEQEHKHAIGNVVDHLFGASRQTDKFIGEVNSAIGDIESLWTRVHKEGKDWRVSEADSLYLAEYGYLKILEGEFEVFSDESSGRFVVTDISK